MLEAFYGPVNPPLALYHFFPEAVAHHKFHVIPLPLLHDLALCLDLQAIIHIPKVMQHQTESLCVCTPLLGSYPQE